ncbi:hypothetical protein J3Q64DRAFT_1706566 [Phycomyces blakesleeanus]|uniref:Uncharacterized protein n=1 Tax=Phycomyces blakesleeanus TaxID=4837 RepID=A0ABR3BC90_PHYBL
MPFSTVGSVLSHNNILAYECFTQPENIYVCTKPTNTIVVIVACCFMYKRRRKERKHGLSRRIVREKKISCINIYICIYIYIYVCVCVCIEF